MGLTARTRNEVQFIALLEKTRALEDNSWRKPHFYEHLKKLHAQLSECMRETYSALSITGALSVLKFSLNSCSGYV